MTARWAAARHTTKDLAVIMSRADAFIEAISTSDYTAMSDANRLFHVAIGRACGNNHLSQWYETLLNTSMRLARLAYAQAPPDPELYDEYHSLVDTEHRALVKALRTRDADQSEKLAREHAWLFRGRIMRYLARNGADEVDLS